MHPSVIIQTTRRAIVDFQSANEKQATHSSTRHGGQAIRWEAPHIGWLKANWDAGHNNAQGRTGFGVVIRDSSGTMVAAKCASRQGILAPSMAEILGAGSYGCPTVRAGLWVL
jgi:hypothetical protein